MENQTPLSVKLARTYLLVISIFYILIGIGGMIDVIYFLPDFIFIPLHLIVSVGAILGMFSRFFLVVPEYFLSQVGYHEIPPFLPFLGVIAITFGIISVISLFNTEHGNKWIKYWRFIFFIAFIITVSNLIFFIPEIDGSVTFFVPNIINLVLMLLAILRLEKWKIENV